LSAQIPKSPPATGPNARFPAEAAQELLRELRGLVMRGLGERLNRMFDGADDLLFGMSEKAQNNDQQRVYFDTMRTMRLSRARLAEEFDARLRENFDGTAGRPSAERREDIDFDQLSLQDSEELEEAIAISNMVGKADGAYRDALFDLDHRLERLADLSPVHLPLAALSPVGFCDAFRASIKIIDIEFAIKLVLYKLFDRLVLGDLGPLYGEILALLERLGVRPDRAPVRRQAPVAAPEPRAQGSDGGGDGGAQPLAADGAASGAASGATFGAAGGQGGPGDAGLRQMGDGGGPSGPLDPHTLQTLRQLGMLPQTGGYASSGAPLDSQTLGALQQLGMLPGMGGRSAAYGQGPSPYAGSIFPGGVQGDAMLASELVAVASGQSVQGVEPGRAWAMTQRAGLVGRMFNEIVADPNLPRGVTGALEELRFPVIKTALSDVSFFSNPQHPVRSLINDLASMAAATRAGGSEAATRFEELVGKVKQQFDLDAEAVRPKAREADPLQEGEIERFLDDQLAQGRERRKVIVDKVRRVVAQELEMQTGTQPVPDTLQPLLRSGWGPMMAMRLLRHGHDSELWRAGMELLHRVLFALNPNSPNARTPAEREALRRDLVNALGEVGMSQDRIDSLVKGLDHALNDVDHSGDVEAPVPAVPAGPGDLPAPDPAAAEVSPEALLNRLLVTGSWFRVYDRANRDTRWLKVMSWYPQTQRVSFAEFDGNNALTLHTRDLLDDLLVGRSEPIDTSPAALHLLAQLRESAPPRAATH